MKAQGAPVGDDEREPLAGKRGEDGEDAEVPDLSGVHVGKAGGALREKKRCKHAESADCAVGRDEYGADVKENWVHVERIAELAGLAVLAELVVVKRALVVSHPTRGEAARWMGHPADLLAR